MEEVQRYYLFELSSVPHPSSDRVVEVGVHHEYEYEYLNATLVGIIHSGF